MADIRLAKPAAGATETVPCEPSARFVFDFPTADATLARDGDDLNITFADGSALKLEDFYQEYTEDTLPSFSVDGTDVAAADFFEAMNEPDLMPAAGPAASPNPAGARFHEWGDSSLTGGIEHLNGLDWGFSRGFEWEDVPNAVGFNDVDSGTLLAGVPTTPGIPGIPDTPDSPMTPSPEDPEATTYDIKVGLPYTGEAEPINYNIVLAVDISKSMVQYTDEGRYFVDIEGYVILQNEEGSNYLHSKKGDTSKITRVKLKDIDFTNHTINGTEMENLYYTQSGKSISLDEYQKMIENTRWDATKTAIEKVLDQYNEYISHNNGDIDLSIITFNGAVQDIDVQLTGDGKLDIDSIMSQIRNLSPVGATNYEAVFLRAQELFSQATDPNATNQLLFLTDGAPTTYNEDESGTTSLTNASDWEKTLTSAHALKTENNVDIAIIGIGKEPKDIDIYADGTKNSNTDDPCGTGDLAAIGTVSYVSTGHGIDAALQECLPLAVAPDTVVGTEDNNILFGDTKPEHPGASDDSELATIIAQNPEAYADTFDGNLPDQLVGGLGNDILYGQGGADLLIGDGDTNEDPDILHTLNAATDGEASKATADSVGAYIKGLDSDGLTSFEKVLDGLESPDDGNDLLFGGSGDDVLLGLGGDDYLNGGDGQDIMFGGSGDDLIVYDSNDYLIDGGDGIDILLAGASEKATLGDLLTKGNGENNMPIVNDVEVLLKGDNVLSLTSLDELADKYGITMKDDKTMTLTGKWEQVKTAEHDVTVWQHEDAEGRVDLTMETTLSHTGTENAETENAVHTLVMNG